MKLNKVEKDVKNFISKIKNDPAARLKSREDFYKRFGASDRGEFGFGNSEIAFMKWENNRVIRSSDAATKGSEWWNAVNLWFIYLSELGAKAAESGIAKTAVPLPAQFWMDFIENPSDSSWYRAHNSSIIDGYLKYPMLAKKENHAEQILINIVLYRLLFAQAMVEGKDFAFGKLGKIFANPRGTAVNLITQFEYFYPHNYPMSPEDVRHLLGKSHDLGVFGMKILDDVLIEPEFAQLYQDASEWNKQPKLLNLLVANKPAYPDGIPKSEGEKKYLIRFLTYLRKLFG